MATALDPFFYFHPDDNIAPDSTVSVVDGTEDPEYPVENATDLTFAKMAAPSKLLETSGGWQGDQGSARLIVGVLLLHNFDEALPCTFEMDSSPVWSGSPATAGALSESIVIPAKRADGYTRKVFLDLRDKVGYGAKRYWHLAAGGGSPANSQPLGIKILLFTRLRQLTSDFQWGVQDEEHQVGIVMKTDAGVRWGYDLASAPRQIRGSALLTDVDAELVREWFRACAGTIKPTVIVPEPTVNEGWLGYFSPSGFSIEAPSIVVSRQANTRQFIDANQTQITIEEVTPGDPEWY